MLLTVQFLLLYAILSGGFIYGLEYLNGYLCPKVSQRTIQKLSTNTVSANGKAILLSHITDSTILNQIKPFGGQDVSSVFPTISLLKSQDPDIQACIDAKMADAWLKAFTKRPGYTVQQNKITTCPLPNGKSGACFATDNVKSFADIVFQLSDVSTSLTNKMSGKALIAINGHVYDVYPYLSEAIIINNGKSVSEGTPSQTTAFLGSEMTTFLFKNIGQDASVAFKSISNAKPYLKCLDKLYYAGMIANPKSFNSINGFIENAGGCNVINLPLITCFKVNPTSYRQKIGNSQVLIFIPIFSETLTQLQECLDSVTKSSFPISQITFVLVVDGLVTPDNQLLNATNSALSALKNKSTHEPHPLAYTSLGEGLKRTNYAKIYSGIFSKYGGENFGIPYVLIEKIGNSYEDDDPIPGNRGKLDSLALIYKFLNNITAENLEPLDEELLFHFGRVSKANSFDYILTLDADTVLDENALKFLVSHLDDHPAIGVAQGSIQTLRPYSSFCSLLSLYPQFVEFSLTPTIQNTFNSFHYNFGNLSLARLSGNVQVEYPQSMHQKILTYFSQDMMLYKSCYHQFILTAVGYTKHTSNLLSLLFQSSQRYRAKVNLLMSSLTLYSVCSLIYTVLSPVFIVYLMYQIEKAVVILFSQQIIFVMNLSVSDVLSSTNIPISLLLAPAVLVLLHFLNSFVGFVRTAQFGFFLAPFIHTLFGLMFFEVLVPLLSLITMESMMWTDSQKPKGVSRLRAVPCLSLNPENPKDKQDIEAPSEHHNNANFAAVKSNINSFKSINQSAHSIISPVKSTSASLKSGAPSYSGSSSKKSTPYQSFYSHSFYSKSGKHTESIITPQYTPIPSPRNKYKDNQKNQEQITHQYLQPTNFNEASPGRAKSFARSDFTDEYDATSEFNRFSRINTIRPKTKYNDKQFLSTIRSTMTSMTRFSLSDSELEELGVTKAEVKEEINLFLQNADLSNITRGDVKEHLYLQLGEAAAEAYDNWINICIEEFTLERLALL